MRLPQPEAMPYLVSNCVIKLIFFISFQGFFRTHLNYKPLKLLAGEEAGPGEGDGDVVLAGLAEGQLVGEVTVVSATKSMTWL